jgi:uncharacterized cupin superfamily protein
MTDKKPVAVEAASLPVKSGSSYPAPFHEPCTGRHRQVLGDVFGLIDFGVNHMTLAPGAWSSQRHWHSHEDELVYVLWGHPTLVTDAGRTTLGPGMCAGFRAGDANGHHLVNDTDDPVIYLEIGSRKADDDGHYSDIDLQLLKRAKGGRYTRKDGTPYD